jgi:CheY-like chemotaxis protein
MFNYIRTGWPTRVATAQLREHKRAQLHVPCRIDAPRGQRFDGGQVQDLSAGGCQVRLVRRAEVGQELFLSFTLPDGTRVHQLPAVVRNAQMTGKACRAGCQFQFDDADLRASIELYVATTLERLEYAGKRKPEVLVIGQTPEEAGSLIEPLCNRGFQVRWAAGAVDGIFRMRMTMPDVVVMSYDQPELRGPGLCLVIKRNERFKSLPVVVYGDGDGSAGRAARDAGAAAYVPSLEDPLNVVRAVAPYAAECMG